jgi:hypothetical protein
MVNVKYKKTSIVSSRTRYADTEKNMISTYPAEDYGNFAAPMSELSSRQPGSIITLHDHSVVCCDICKTRVKGSLLIGEAGHKRRVSDRQVFNVG